MAKILRQPIPQLSKKPVPRVAKQQTIKVIDGRYCPQDQLRAFARLADQPGNQGAFTVRDYHGADAVGRSVAMEVLEYFDARIFTCRNGNKHFISGGIERLPM